MSANARSDVTAILCELSGDSAPVGSSPEQLLPLVYDELRRLAGSYLRRERSDHTLQPTALVHEAYERLADPSRVDWRGRTHFFAVGAQMMRRVLVDHARHRGRRKRGGGGLRVTLAGLEAPNASDLDAADLLALDRALKKLAALDLREARIVELRYFAGLEVQEIASLLDISERTARNDWTHARAWLRLELCQGG